MHRILDVRPMPRSTLQVTFAEERVCTIDLSDLIRRGGVFARLAAPAFFREVRIGENGRFLEWPGELDLCADALWERATAPAVEEAATA